jgi:tetratricopeptide (TPR) repeat protein
VLRVAHLPLIAVLISSVSLAMPARAAESADQLIRKGLELRRRGDDLGALPLFDQAYRLSPTPRAAAQRGFCAQALGRWTQAESDLMEALKSADDAWVKKNRGAIDESLRQAKMKVAMVEVIGEPSGADVLINGRVVGQLPLAGPVRIEAGEVDVELRAEGHRRSLKSLHLDGGQYQRIALRADLDAAPAHAPAPGKPDVSFNAQQPPTGATVTAHAAEPASGSGAGSAPKWISWGLGAVALGVGTYGYVHYRNLLGDFNAGCAFDERGQVYVHVPSPGRTVTTCEGLHGDYRSARTLGVVGFAGAGALAITGLVFFLTEPRSGEGRTAYSCAPDVGSQNRLLVGCSLRF